MIARIVAATDFSPEADLALSHAVAIARRHGAALTIVYAEADRSSDEHHALGEELEELAA